MDPIDEHCFAFEVCILCYMIDYQNKAADKTKASSDKGLVAPLSTKQYIINAF